MNNTRVNQVDTIKLLTASCLLIVLLLHYPSYTRDILSPLRKLHIDLYLQRFAVGGFIFLSGFKLASSKLSTSVKNFIANRFFRIHLLYLITLIVYSFTVYPFFNNHKLPSWQNFVFHSIGLQSIIPNAFGSNYHTIWFISVLYFCYAFFLISRTTLYKPIYFVIVSVLFCSSIWLLRSLFGYHNIIFFQQDLELYVSFFAFGMASSQSFFKTKINILNSKLLFFISISSGVLFLILSSIKDFTNNIFLVFIQFTVLLLSILSAYFLVFRFKFSLPNNIYYLLDKIVESLFCVFLLHRPIWTVLFWFWSERSLIQGAYILIIGLPIILFISFKLQTSYNNLVLYFYKK